MKLEDKVLNKPGKSIHLVTQSFNSCSELGDNLKKGDVHNGMHPDSCYIGPGSTGKPRKSFNGFNSEKQLDYGLTYGTSDPSDIRAVSDKITKFKQSTPSKQSKTVWDVTGGTLIVPMYLTGIPTCWMRREKLQTVRPRAELVIDVGVDYTITTEQMREASTQILCVLCALDKAGYNTALYAAAFTDTCLRDHNDRDTFLACIARVKASDEKFNLNRIMFPLTDPAFLRGAVFTWMNKLPASVDYRLPGGLGAPISFRDDYYDLASEMIGKGRTVISLGKLIEESRWISNTAAREAEIRKLVIERLQVTFPKLKLAI